MKLVILTSCYGEVITAMVANEDELDPALVGRLEEAAQILGYRLTIQKPDWPKLQDLVDDINETMKEYAAETAQAD
jgi:hypothetical protein